MAVLPSALMLTEIPCIAAPVLPVPINLFPCWLQVPPLFKKIQTAPWLELSAFPPAIIVVPSALILTELPIFVAPTVPEPTNLLPC